MGLFLLGALSAAVLPRFTRLSYGFAFAGSVAAIAAALLPREDPVVLVSLASVAPFAALSFRLDALAGYFLLIIGVLVAPVSIYAFGAPIGRWTWLGAWSAACVKPPARVSPSASAPISNWRRGGGKTWWFTGLYRGKRRWRPYRQVAGASMRTRRPDGSRLGSAGS